MQKIIQLVLFVVLIGNVLPLQSQQSGKNIRGRLINESTGKPLSGLTISLNDELEGVKSDVDGIFHLYNLKDTAYTISIKMDSLLLKRVDVKLRKQRTNLGNVKIDHPLLAADSLVPITTYYNEMLKTVAAAFPVNPNGTLDELILRMPGIMRIDGKLYVQGQLLQELMIDGNIFFVSNDDAVLHNFPLSFVDTVTIFDDISDAKTSTDFDDNIVYKAIGLKPKKEYENSLFGHAYAGLGSGERWNMGANINYFKGKRQFSLIQQTNNINAQTFSPYEMDNAMGNNNLTAFTDRAASNSKTSFYQFINSVSDFTIDQENGINSTNSFGMSYFDTYSKGSFYGNYFYNSTDNITNGSVSRQYFSNNTYNEKINSISTNINHRLRTKLYYNWGENNVLKISPRLYMQKTTGTYNADSEFIDSTNAVSKAFNQNIVDVSANNATAAINYIKTFNKARRTFTIDLYPSYTQTKGNWSLLSNMSIGNSLDTLNTATDYDKGEISGSGEVLYTEPITTNGTLLAGYLFNYNIAELEKNTALQQSNLFIEDISTNMLINDAKNYYMANGAKLMYRYKGKNWRISPGLIYQYAAMDVQTSLFPNSRNSSYSDWLPVAYFHYSFSDKANLKVNYTTSTTTPTTDQLLELLDMTNPFNFTAGNPDLKQSKSSIVEFKHTYMFKNRLSNLYTYLGFIATNNYIATQNYTLKLAVHDASQDSATVAINRPVNMNNYANAFGFINYNTRFKSIGANFGTNLHYRYYHIPSMDQTQSYFANQNMGGFGVSLNSALREWFTFYVASNTDYNYISNTLNSSISKYLRQNTTLKVDFWIVKDLLLSTDLEHRFNYGLAEGYDNSYFVWNAFVGYRFLKNKSLEVHFSIHDILNSNENVQQSVTDYYVEDIRTNNLQRYFMVSVLYNLNILNINPLQTGHN